MNETALPFDPQVTDLLREALGGRENGLFPKLTRGSLRSLQTFEEPLSGGALDLTKAQRELISVARAEAAFLLNEAWNVDFAADRTWGPVFSRWVTADREVRPLEPDRWRRRARFGLDHGGNTPRDRPWRGLLREGLEADPLAWRKPLELLMTANRLVPNESTRIRIGLELLRLGQPHSAERILRGVAHGTHSDLIESIARGNVGLCRFLASDLRGALASYRRSALTTELRPASVIDWHLAACQAGDDSEALESAQCLDELVPPNHPAVETAVASHATRRTAGTWQASPASGLLLRRIGGRVGLATKAIDHVFTSTPA